MIDSKDMIGKADRIEVHDNRLSAVLSGLSDEERREVIEAIKAECGIRKQNRSTVRHWLQGHTPNVLYREHIDMALCKCGLERIYGR